MGMRELLIYVKGVLEEYSPLTLQRWEGRDPDGDLRRLHVQIGRCVDKGLLDGVLTARDMPRLPEVL